MSDSITNVVGEPGGADRKMPDSLASRLGPSVPRRVLRSIWAPPPRLALLHRFADRPQRLQCQLARGRGRGHPLGLPWPSLWDSHGLRLAPSSRIVRHIPCMSHPSSERTRMPALQPYPVGVRVRHDPYWCVARAICGGLTPLAGATPTARNQACIDRKQPVPFA